VEGGTALRGTAKAPKKSEVKRWKGTCYSLFEEVFIGKRYSNSPDGATLGEGRGKVGTR